MFGRFGIGRVGTGGAGVSFDPSSPFGVSDQGFAFDFRDAATLFENSNGTGAVVLTDPIGFATDLSGKDNHATQATGAARPLFQGAADFDGIDDLLATAAVDLSGSDKLTLVIAMQHKAVLGEYVNVGAGAGSGRFYMNFVKAIADLAGSTGTSSVLIDPAPADTDVLYTVLFDLAGATATDEILIRKDGAVPAQTVNGAGPAGAGNFGISEVLAIGGVNFPSDIRVYRAFLINRWLAGDELAAVEAWVFA